jgi:hypothetical protein
MFFPPELVVEVKAIACQLPAELGRPFSRLHVPDIRDEVVRRGLVAEISGATIWRWLADDALRPWTSRSWIFPRDPDFEAKAGPILDLYARQFQGRRLTANDFVISAVRRLEGRYPNLRLVHCPIRSSWLNQIEIYFSIVQRKVLTPNDFADLAAVERRLHDFERLYEQAARFHSNGSSRVATWPDSCGESRSSLRAQRLPEYVRKLMSQSTKRVSRMRSSMRAWVLAAHLEPSVIPYRHRPARAHLTG